MRIKFWVLVAITISLFTVNAHAAISSWANTEQARVRLLVAGVEKQGDHVILQAGLEYVLKDGWKTYWRTPGDVGMPPSFSWEGSKNIGTVNVQWPIPERHAEISDIQDFIYQDRVILPLSIPLIEASQNTELSLSLQYLVCRELCIPLDAQISLLLPAIHTDAKAAALIAPFIKKVPQQNGKNGLSILSYRLQPTKKGALLEVKATSRNGWNVADLIVEGVDGVRFLKPTITHEDNNHASFAIPVQGSASKTILAGSNLHLTLINDGNRAVEQEVTVSAMSEFQPIGDALHVEKQPTSLLAIVLIAILGGLILNVMPCVLPVLSIKLLGIIRHGGADKRQIRANFLASSLGIITSFLAIAGGLIILKSLGHAIGFGFQFQEPAFLISLIVILVLFACNLWGLFEIHLPYWIGGFVSDKIQNADNTLVAHFLTGAFVTVLATPCSAPFVGTAISFALSHGAIEIIMIFTAMGIGLALPYLLLILFPQFVTKLPKPGAWMEKCRMILGAALIATALWLIWIVSNQLGVLAALALFLLCLLLKFAIEVKGRIFRIRFVRGGFIVAIMLSAFVLPLKVGDINHKQIQLADEVWQNFDEEKIAEYVADGKIIVVDVTADWCLSCKINKLTLFNRFDILRHLKRSDVVAMRADITLPNPKIVDYLKSFGRYGIPFNVVYGPTLPNGLPLSELPSKEELLLAIKQANQKDEKR